MVSTSALGEALEEDRRWVRKVSLKHKAEQKVHGPTRKGLGNMNTNGIRGRTRPAQESLSAANGALYRSWLFVQQLLSGGLQNCILRGVGIKLQSVAGAYVRAPLDVKAHE